MPSYYDQIFHRFRETSSNELIETVFVIRKIVKAEGVINDAVQLAARIWIHFFGRTNTIFRIKNTHRLDWIFVGSLACCRSIRWQMSKDQFFFSRIASLSISGIKIKYPKCIFLATSNRMFTFQLKVSSKMYLKNYQ